MKDKELTQECPKGLYVPQLESDACGTGLIANLNGHPSHQLVEDAIYMLVNMEHRGACGCDPNTGDGAGILTQIPDQFFRRKTKELGFELPEFGHYGVGMVFFPLDRNLRRQVKVLFNDYVDEMGFELLGYRKVPTDNESIGDAAASVEPRMEQVFVKPIEPLDRKSLERKLFVLRKFSTHNIHRTFPQSVDSFYITSFSYKTIIYKGQLTTYQLRPYFPDLHNEEYVSAIALVHSRFSTNTVPKWKLAQPFRYLAHNGEINTIRGNLNWWKSKEKALASEVFTAEELEKLYPIVGKDLSDSGSFDNVLEYLVLSGRTLPHALMMMIPEAWHHDPQMEAYKKDFYNYHEQIMEPWDGPASITFTDGILVGATLDRNGLRPSRYTLTDDNVLVVSSETGALEIPP
ncbi:MAG: glutamate synthase subunit alpha, partial [Bacteroidota bacterium]